MSCTLFKNQISCKRCHDEENFKIKEFLPTPWQGEIGENTKILFLGLNPSPNPIPKINCKPHEIIEFAKNGHSIRWSEFEILSDVEKETLKNEIYTTLCVDRSRLKINNMDYWTYSYKVAQSILRENKPTMHDYVLTEIVHCQSKKFKKEFNTEPGRDFIQNCFDENLTKILKLMSNIKFIVTVGIPAFDALKYVVNLDETKLKSQYQLDNDSRNRSFKIYKSQLESREIYVIKMDFFGQSHQPNEEILEVLGLAIGDLERF